MQHRLLTQRPLSSSMSVVAKVQSPPEPKNLPLPSNPLKQLTLTFQRYNVTSLSETKLDR